MTVIIRKSSPADLSQVLALLQMVELPVDGVKEHFNNFLIAVAPGNEQRNLTSPIIGCVGLELYGASALLRSLAVHPNYQKQGLGSRLTDAITDQAIEQKVRTLFLLTDSAVNFFLKFGFQLIDRERVIEDVQQSIEFTTLCLTASSMQKTL